MICCSLKMSDTERLREEYNQLVEGILGLFIPSVSLLSSPFK